MRINQKWLKHRHHTNQLKLPKCIRENFAKEITEGNTPSPQQIKIAVALGVVKKQANGNLDAQSLDKYFKIFLKQRQADDQRHQDL